MGKGKSKVKKKRRRMLEARLINQKKIDNEKQRRTYIPYPVAYEKQS